MFDLPTATRFTLRESVVERLYGAILTGAIAQGTHLAEVELSESLAVSRGTLREALRQLQQQGILVQDRRGRVSVRSLTASDVEDLFEVRVGLESIALRRLCEMADRSAVVKQLTANLENLRRATGELIEGIRADMTFHDSICRLTGNAALLHTWRSIGGSITLAMVSAGSDRARDNMRADRHAPIVRFIAHGDANGGLAYLRDHMDSALLALIERLNPVR